VFSSPHPYSLSQLLSHISDTLQAQLQPSYWVMAEVSSLSVRDGHAYFELVEKAEQTGMPAAKTRATSWRNQYAMLSAYFQSETGETLRPGLQILVEVMIDFHPLYGFALNIIDIDPTYTKGDLAKQREQTLARLHAEGIFDMNHELPLPTLPKRIAVISSSDAAGYGDFCHQIQQSPYGAAFSFELFTALLQGDCAAQSMIDALNAIYARVDSFDLVVVIRGGGSQLDLACFDDYDLAAHCAQFPLPVVAGIGHQRDVSVLDMVAHTSLKTPTAVSAWLVDIYDAQNQHLSECYNRLQRTVSQLIVHRQYDLNNCSLRLKLQHAAYLQSQRAMFDLALKKLQLFSPETIFRKGYSFTRINGKPVASVTLEDISEGDQVETFTLQAYFLSVISKKN